MVALLRKEKPKAALRELCIDQLEVFLAKGDLIIVVVDMQLFFHLLMFLCLHDNHYICTTNHFYNRNNCFCGEVVSLP